MEATDDLMITTGHDQSVESNVDDLEDRCCGDCSKSTLLLEDNLLRYLSVAGVETVLSLLGGGTFGKVYCCEVAGFEQPIAVKVCQHGCRKNLAISRELALLLPDISHPKIVRFLGVVDTLPMALLSEYCSGGSLSELVHGEGRALFEQWPLTFRARTMLDTAEAMAYLHARDIIHGDIKPANAFLATPPNRVCVPLVKLADLGHAWLRQSDLNSELTNTVGNLAYMSPEMILCESYDTSTDVYSWAIMLQEVCAGRKPYSDCGPGAVARLLLNICFRGHRPDVAWIPRAADTATMRTDIIDLLGCCWKQDAPKRASADRAANEVKRILGLEE